MSTSDFFYLTDENHDKTVDYLVKKGLLTVFEDGSIATTALGAMMCKSILKTPIPHIKYVDPRSNEILNG